MRVTLDLSYLKISKKINETYIDKFKSESRLFILTTYRSDWCKKIHIWGVAAIANANYGATSFKIGHLDYTGILKKAEKDGFVLVSDFENYALSGWVTWGSLLLQQVYPF